MLFLRPSQLPFCPADFFVQNAAHGTMRSLDFAGCFYTSVGTVVHEVLQQALCLSGKLLANYECKECGTWHNMSYKYECCGFPTTYHELSIKYKGISGHIDGVLDMGDGTHSVIDFKTTGVNAAAKKAKDPGVVYVEQIEAYAVLLELQYGLKISGISDIFVLRDNPTKDPAIFTRAITDERRSVIKKRLKRYLKMHRETLDVSTLKEALALLEYDRCTNPYCPVCKLDDEGRRREVKKAYKLGKAAGHVPIRGMAERAIAAKAASSKKKKAA
ncbi:CRISPR/Cas system associated [Burkholderia phage BcepSaruman]|uniref:PD-(D/E)XK endonuclease-like domain-containing protein n=1 Tax=Burkholderia phage BcepSaruman TaxID=2530032 RepID=A0A4D5ZCZ6_9CAUD|nr:CRISPR/Cas system associated [Burkholderia phage BcepSaruman]QBX06701.1 hypothetical protein BcepSaruman_288 [Burkholderia phage BcepSaruman]